MQLGKKKPKSKHLSGKTKMYVSCVQYSPSNTELQRGLEKLNTYKVIHLYNGIEAWTPNVEPSN